jgi:chromosome segregation ATPase
MGEAAELAGAQTVGGRDYGDNMPDAHARIDSLKEDIREIGYSLLDLQAKAQTQDAKLDKILATLGAHDARFEANDNRFDRIDGQLTAHDNRFDRIDGQLTAHDNRFDRIDGQLTEILSRLPAAPA